MHPETGQIVQVQSEEEALAKGLVPLTEEEMEAVREMTAEERRAWAKTKLQQYRPHGRVVYKAQVFHGNRKSRRAQAADARRSRRRIT